MKTVYQQSLIVACITILAASCNRHTPSIIGPGPQRLTITLNQPVGLGKDAPLLAGGQQARFSAVVEGVNGPFNISWNFGGSADNTTSSLAVAGTSTVDVPMKVISGQQDYTATVTVTDGAGVTQVDSINYQLLGWNNSAPLIEDVTLSSSNLLTVTASDADGDELSFSLRNAVTDEDYGPPDTLDANVAVWDLSTELAPSPNDILAGGNPAFEGLIVTVTDEFGASVESEQLGGNFEAFPLEDDTLYAIATQTHALVGDKVRIVVATGDTAFPFQFLSGCRVTCNDGASYVPGSLDVGAPDETPDIGNAQPIDGVWGDMGAGSFLNDPNVLLTYSDGIGISWTDFNLTPLGGKDITANGLLFNFEMEFDQPGSYTLGFEEVNVISRTFYLDSTAATDHFWSDISNNHAYNTIVVE